MKIEFLPIEVKFEKIHKDAKLPTRATDGRAYYDCYSAEEIAILPGQIKVVSTGLKIQPPPGYFIDIRPRSGMASKGITINNAPGTLDMDYGDIFKVILINHSKSSYIINVGDRICQINVMPMYEIEWVNSKISGTSGFGSTGV
jgi:dUTP pyrophosphatase